MGYGSLGLIIVVKSQIKHALEVDHECLRSLVAHGIIHKVHVDVMRDVWRTIPQCVIS